MERLFIAVFQAAGHHMHGIDKRHAKDAAQWHDQVRRYLVYTALQLAVTIGAHANQAADLLLGHVLLFPGPAEHRAKAPACVHYLPPPRSHGHHTTACGPCHGTIHTMTAKDPVPEIPVRGLK